METLYNPMDENPGKGIAFARTMRRDGYGPLQSSHGTEPMVRRCYANILAGVEEPAGHLDRANQHYVAGRTHAAVEAMLAHIRQKPDDVSAHECLAAWLAQTGNFPAAGLALWRCAELDSSVAKRLVLEAYSYLSKLDVALEVRLLADLIETLYTAVSEDSNEPVLMLLLALILDEWRDHDGANEYYEKAEMCSAATFTVQRDTFVQSLAEVRRVFAAPDDDLPAFARTLSPSVALRHQDGSAPVGPSGH